MTKASDCKCVECGEQAVAFWPVIDPDIPSNPYCRKCLDKAKAEVIKRIMAIDQIGDDNNNSTKKKQLKRL